MTNNEINRLFDLTAAKLNREKETFRRERWIFEQVFKDSALALKKMWAFLEDVTTCPQEVLEFCQKLLAPDAVLPE